MTISSEQSRRRRRRRAVTAAVPAMLVLGACSADATGPPEDPPSSNPAAASSETAAAFAFRDELCDQADWSLFDGVTAIKPTEYDVADYEPHSGRMDCVRYFEREKGLPGTRSRCS